MFILFLALIHPLVISTGESLKDRSSCINASSLNKQSHLTSHLLLLPWTNSNTWHHPSCFFLELSHMTSHLLLLPWTNSHTWHHTSSIISKTIPGTNTMHTSLHIHPSHPSYCPLQPTYTSFPSPYLRTFRVPRERENIWWKIFFLCRPLCLELPT